MSYWEWGRFRDRSNNVLFGLEVEIKANQKASSSLIDSFCKHRDEEIDHRQKLNQCWLLLLPCPCHSVLFFCFISFSKTRENALLVFFFLILFYIQPLPFCVLGIWCCPVRNKSRHCHKRNTPNLIMANLRARPCWRWEPVPEQSRRWKEAVQPPRAACISALPGKMQMSSDTRQVCD